MDVALLEAALADGTTEGLERAAALYKGEFLAGLNLNEQAFEEWRDAMPRFVASAFPGATARDCPPLDHCWSAGTELAAGVLGDRSVFVSGPGSDLVAAALLN